jgi:hypothetical protein
MTHRKTIQTLLAPLAAMTCASAMLVGCGEEPPAVVQAPPPPPPKAEAPPPPKVPTIAELMARLDIDPRVNLPEERAPQTEEQRVAVLKFYDSFARGNADALKPMLSAPDQFLLAEMVDAGTFAKSTADISRIDVRCGTEGGNTCALAVFHVGEGFEPQLWVYDATKSTPEFDAVATPPAIMNKLSGDNPIAVWYEVLRLELAKADEPDEQPALPKQDFTKEQETSSSSDEGSAPAGAPSGSPGKRMPGAPIKAPKPPGFGTK